MCVGQFPRSQTRSAIMKNLQDVVQEMKGCGKLWVNGGFLTLKENPGDVDLLLESDGVKYDSGEYPEFNQKVDWFRSNLKQEQMCDSYVCFLLPNDHPQFQFWHEQRQYWKRQFGFDRSDQPKGIAIVDLGKV